ncbi:MAG: transcriptional repressor [Alphaproteobacteria bacterium]|nr:transcriptional repressor [Alphaproteobacteria bacterium]
MAHDGNPLGNGGEDGGNGSGKPPHKCPLGLTKNEKLVWDVMAATHPDPLKAYEILDELKVAGVRAPMTVYRALEGLEAKGHIHKLDGLNAFLLCNHEGPHVVQTFLVCEKCSNVQELELLAVEADIAPAVTAAAFDMHTARLEIKGNCMSCKAA